MASKKLEHDYHVAHAARLRIEAERLTDAALRSAMIREADAVEALAAEAARAIPQVEFGETLMIKGEADSYEGQAVMTTLRTMIETMATIPPSLWFSVVVSFVMTTVGHADEPMAMWGAVKRQVEGNFSEIDAADRTAHRPN